MTESVELATARLLMRRWHPADGDPFAALNADALVMEHFPAPLDRRASDGLIRRIDAHFEEHGYGFWALELRASGELIGFTGLQVVSFQAHFTPAVEVGWRLARAHWQRGYATEAARAALSFGFGRAGLEQIVSFTSVANERSRAVMRRIGMSRDEREDFDHPQLAASSPLRRHVLYRISAADWREGDPAGRNPPGRVLSRRAKMDEGAGSIGRS
jgi:RimJ/RimL family protein N-acetyltransferase